MTWPAGGIVGRNWCLLLRISASYRLSRGPGAVSPEDQGANTVEGKSRFWSTDSAGFRAEGVRLEPWFCINSICTPTPQIVLLLVLHVNPRTEKSQLYQHLTPRDATRI